MIETRTENPLVTPLVKLESFLTLTNAIKKNKTPIHVTGVIDSQKVHLAYAVAQHLDKPTIIITHSENHAKEICEDMRFFLRNDENADVKFYPAKDIIFMNADVRSINITKQRLDILNSLANDENIVLVTSIEAIFDKISTMKTFKSSILTIKVGDELPLTKLLERLVQNGYERTEIVEGAGQFAVRGGIVDIFTTVYETAIRLEFWGDEIDSIRLLDGYAARSIEKLDSATIFPMNEMLTQNVEQSASIFDYLNDETIVFFDEPKKIASHAETVIYEFNESVQSKILNETMQAEQLREIFQFGDILAFAHKFKIVLLSLMAQSMKDFHVKETVDLSVKSAAILNQNIELLAEDLKHYTKNGYRVLMLTASKTRGQRLCEEISAFGISAGFVANISDLTLLPKTVSVTQGTLHKGFEYEHINLVFLTDKELFREEKKKRKGVKKKTGAKIDSFTDLKVGDYIVHENHGIGVYRGIEQISTDGLNKDYLKLSYSDGGSLYVHTSQMDMIQKYIGGDGVKIKLNKLGGADWAKAKAKTKSAVKVLAKDLIDLYAKRQASTGFVYGKDTVWQKEFEEMFPFVETDDQIVAIEDVKSDMESPRVMDRLICGDVGYGKTEVAIRAAFKAVQDGKQTAYLVPTTILAQQHYNTFKERMKDFPIGIEMLSRFRTKKQQEESILKIETGQSDIVIGTHRLLSKDVRFKDLGLIIVDEEQRFGVTHKEKLKLIKENVDVLTLTATPIPRTLHMSLTGIRDMSILEEPPQERRPIQTYVMEFNMDFVKDAIARELNRGGQVYYLHNRVRNIAEVCAKIQALVPDATVAYAHGQMSEHQLENIMVDFINGEISVLVCTTIIETGLDISNVNTIIIQDADFMGLSQLYQLRGRVGRSNRQAYAYLMYKRDKVLQEVAEKRLQAIREFTEFGSGFRIAMRDMEIRGAGNLIGGEQHGHMDAVGYDMYCKLLDEAIKEMKNEVVVADFETTIDINVNAYIPEYYVKNEEQKLELYKKIAQIRTEQDYFDIQEEIEDRFGNLAKSVQNLLEIALLKAFAHNIDVIAVKQKGENIVLTFATDAKVDPNKIMQVVTENPLKLSFSVGIRPALHYKMEETSTVFDSWELINLIKKIIA